MNPAFILIVIISLVILWFLLSFLFCPIGKLTHRIYKDAVDEINKEDVKNKEEENL